MVITFVGFLLTGGIGATFAWWLNSLSVSQEALATARSRTIAATEDVVDLINERLARAELVASAINRGASQLEAETRKSAYDEAYIRYNARMESMALRIQRNLQIAGIVDFPLYLGTLTSSPDTKSAGSLRIIDRCLTSSFDAYRLSNYQDTKNSSNILLVCDFNKLSDEARNVRVQLKMDYMPLRICRTSTSFIRLLRKIR